MLLVVPPESLPRSILRFALWLAGWAFGFGVSTDRKLAGGNLPKMSNLPLVCDGTPGLCAGFVLQAQDNNGNRQSANGTATISNYNSAFVVPITTDTFQIVVKIVKKPGDPTETVTATFNLNDAASGVALPPQVVSVDLVAPPPPGQLATQVVLISGPTRGVGSAAQDPGGGTIPVSLS